MKNNIWDIEGSFSNRFDKILNRSTPAICGAFEREVIVDSSRVQSTKSLLRKKGYVIIGTGPAGFGKTKIWFNPAGMLL